MSFNSFQILDEFHSEPKRPSKPKTKPLNTETTTVEKPKTKNVVPFEKIDKEGFVTQSKKSLYKRKRKR